MHHWTCCWWRLLCWRLRHGHHAAPQAPLCAKGGAHALPKPGGCSWQGCGEWRLSWASNWGSRAARSCPGEPLRLEIAFGCWYHCYGGEGVRGGRGWPPLQAERELPHACHLLCGPPGRGRLVPEQVAQRGSAAAALTYMPFGRRVMPTRTCPASSIAA